MTTLSDSPLGKATAYPDAYDPALLFPVERAPQRKELGLSDVLPFTGADRWTAWEVSWLDATGRPQVAVATFTVPCTSPRIVESKSVKLYLTALNNVRFGQRDDLAATLARDLTGATGAEVGVNLIGPESYASLARGEPQGACIDGEPLASASDGPDPALLATAGPVVLETLYTRVFRSVCPVTGQPDYATLWVHYRGPRIDRAALLAYLVSFRHHPGFHEHCVETIFVDLHHGCRPQALAVEARFGRRGGVDINPFRSNASDFQPASAPTIVQ
jgi:7-cyano-7-deazaguanine reductase